MQSLNLTQTGFKDPLVAELNRQKFSKEMDVRSKRPRNGLFSQPAPLVVGDDSRNYQTFRKERSQCGAVKSMTINRCKGTKETFGSFASNGISDPYQDAGQYILRKPDRASSQLAKKPWAQSGCNKKVKKSEFAYTEQGPPARPRPESKPRFGTRVKPEPFTSLNKIGYSEDPYERAQDLERAEYSRLNTKIMYRDQPFSNTVKQRGTFYPHNKTYGTERYFPEKKPVKPQPALFGAFKPGDPLKTGHNKCIGGRNGTTEEKYVEEQEPLWTFSPTKRHQTPWNGTAETKSMINSTTLNNFRNVNREKAMRPF